MNGIGNDISKLKGYSWSSTRKKFIKAINVCVKKKESQTAYHNILRVGKSEQIKL